MYLKFNNYDGSTSKLLHGWGEHDASTPAMGTDVASTSSGGSNTWIKADDTVAVIAQDSTSSSEPPS